MTSSLRRRVIAAAVTALIASTPLAANAEPAAPSASAPMTVAGDAKPGVVFTTYRSFGGKTHYYHAYDSSLDYNDAADFGAEFAGSTAAPEHLPTITSQDENDAVASLLPNIGGYLGYGRWAGAWIAGADAGPEQTIKRNFQWAAGPEAGSTFTSCTENLDNGSCTTPEGAFSNFANGEPNNGGGLESAVEMYPRGSDFCYYVYVCQSTDGLWNDADPRWSRRVVQEYEVDGETAATVPDAPVNVSHTWNYHRVKVTWSRPVSDGGSPITGYKVTLHPSGLTCTASGMDATGCTVLGVPYGDVSATVQAINAVGESADSAPSETTTTKTWTNVDLPDGDFSLLAAAARDDVTQETDYWSYQAHDANGSRWHFNADTGWGFAPAKSVVLSGVWWWYWSGCDRGDDASGVLYTDGPARLCWTSYTADGEAKLGAYGRTGNNWGQQGYRAIYTSDDPTYYPFGPRTNVASTAVTDGGWTLCYSDTYGNGSGVPIADILKGCSGKYLLMAAKSGPNVDWPAGAPLPPHGAQAVAGADGEGVVSWQAPLNEGDSPVTGYTVTASSGQTCTTDGALTCTVKGLTNYQDTTFTVTATNGTGTSLASAASNSIYPRVDGFHIWLPNATAPRLAAVRAWAFNAGPNRTITLKVGTATFTCDTGSANDCYADIRVSNGWDDDDVYANAKKQFGKLAVSATSLQQIGPRKKHAKAVGAYLYVPKAKAMSKVRAGGSLNVKTRNIAPGTTVKYVLSMTATDANGNGFTYSDGNWAWRGFRTWYRACGDYSYYNDGCMTRDRGSRYTSYYWNGTWAREYTCKADDRGVASCAVDIPPFAGTVTVQVIAGDTLVDTVTVDAVKDIKRRT